MIILILNIVYFSAALKKWKDLSNELHETTVTLKNEFQETSLAATLNLGAGNVGEDKSSLIEEPEKDEIMEIKDVENANDISYNEFSTYLSDCPTSAY